MIKGFYTGCVKSGNMGDDILFFIFINILVSFLKNKFAVNCIIQEEKIFQEKDCENYFKNSDIGVVGGGSLLHPEEISYTLPIQRNNKIRSSFIFGTGISDTGKFKLSKIDIKNILLKKYQNFNFPINEPMKINLEIIDKIDFGGLRGPVDLVICNSFIKNFSKKYIYDPGLLAGNYIDYSKKNLFNNKNIIGVNFGLITHQNKISLRDESYDDYMSRIIKEIVNYCKKAIENNYILYFYSMSLKEINLHNNIINMIDPSLVGEKIFTRNSPLNYQDFLSICSNFKCNSDQATC